jgi:ectoine hydroxylase-related dioxygenase (phytanoyl-CoA dioxygenase family)
LTLAIGGFAADGIWFGSAVASLSTVLELRDLAAFQSGSRPGARAFSVEPAVKALVEAGGTLANFASELMGAPARAVRVLYFDKTPDMNWAVPWHQDRTIAVANRIDVPGFSPWSLKAGVHHVEPPEAILVSIVSLRLHLDDCGPDNGPLMAVRGSFLLGRVPVPQIKAHVERGTIQICCANAGDLVAMRGLTIHASQRAARPGHRRVLHVDFSTAGLPGGLEWAMP